MKIIKFNSKEKFAITEDEGVISMWGPVEYANGLVKVFHKDGQKTLVLASDKGYHWKDSAKKAPYCEYHEVWFGEFPYGSWAYGIRKCLVTGEVKVSTFETEINPRGQTGQDEWRDDCRTYAPEGLVCA